VLARDAAGEFAPPTKLLDSAGNVLRLGQYWDYDAKMWTGVAESKFKESLGIGATSVDWDNDGDLDLLLGSFQGQFFVRLNEGSATAPSFATESIAITAGDTPLEVTGRDAIPKIADWDGDGLFDILSGSGDGGLFWLRNNGELGAPSFEQPQPLVQKPESSGEGDESAWPGERTQVSATDYDDDGDLDLIVGDMSSDGNRMHGWVWLFRRR